MVALALGSEFAIEHEEAKQLAQATAAVSAFYETSALSPKALAWIGLCGVIANVHGPRIMARGLRAKMESEAKRATAPSQRQQAAQPSPHAQQRPTLTPEVKGAFFDPSFVLTPSTENH
jgi:hypothetical protein